MTGAEGTAATETTAVESGAPGPEATQETSPAGNVHPAWESLRSEVGDPTFHLLQPHLKKFDEEATGRVTRANEELKKYSELGDYDTLRNGADFVQQLNDDPVVFARQLVDLLKEQGRWEEAAAVEDTIGDDESSVEVDPRDKELTELRARLETIEGASNQQNAEKQAKQWNDEWDAQFAAAQAKNPWLTRDDDDLLRTFAGNHIASDSDPIEGVFAKSLEDLSKFRDRTLTTQRPGASAPRLIPGGGGNPAAAQPTDVSKLGRSATVDLVTNLIRARNSG